MLPVLCAPAVGPEEKTAPCRCGALLSRPVAYGSAAVYMCPCCTVETMRHARATGRLTVITYQGQRAIDAMVAYLRNESEGRTH